MADSVILNTPLLLLFFGSGLGLNLLDRHFRASRGRLTLISAVVVVVSCTYALLLGAGIEETVTVLLAFLCLNLEGWK